MCGVCYLHYSAQHLKHCLGGGGKNRHSETIKKLMTVIEMEAKIFLAKCRNMKHKVRERTEKAVKNSNDINR